MRNTSAGLLISLIIHAGIVYFLVFFLQVPPAPEKLKTVPISLSMFQPEPKPVFETISAIPELPTIAEKIHLDNDFALLPLPIPKKVKPRKRKVVKVKAKRRLKKKTVKAKRKSQSKKQITKAKRKSQSKKQVTKAKRKTKSQPKKQVTKSKPKKQIVKVKPVKPKITQARNKVKVNKSKEAEKAYRRKLNRLIAQKKTYPRKAKRMGQQGVVRVSFTVLANGKIKNIRIGKSSGSSSLDKATKKLIKKISGLLPFSKSIQRKQWQFHINIKYKLH